MPERRVPEQDGAETGEKDDAALLGSNINSPIEDTIRTQRIKVRPRILLAFKKEFTETGAKAVELIPILFR